MRGSIPPLSAGARLPTRGKCGATIAMPTRPGSSASSCSSACSALPCAVPGLSRSADELRAAQPPVGARHRDRPRSDDRRRPRRDPVLRRGPPPRPPALRRLRHGRGERALVRRLPGARRRAAPDAGGLGRVAGRILALGLIAAASFVRGRVADARWALRLGLASAGSRSAGSGSLPAASAARFPASSQAPISPR